MQARCSAPLAARLQLFTESCQSAAEQGFFSRSSATKPEFITDVSGHQSAQLSKPDLSSPVFWGSAALFLAGTRSRQGPAEHEGTAGTLLGFSGPPPGPAGTPPSHRVGALLNCVS